MGNILAFSGHQVCSVTGLTLRQLAYWDKTGFFSPAFPEDGLTCPPKTVPVWMGVLRVLRNERRTDAKQQVHRGADHRCPEGTCGGDGGEGAVPAAGGRSRGALPLQTQLRRDGGERGQTAARP